MHCSGGLSRVYLISIKPGVFLWQGTKFMPFTQAPVNVSVPAMTRVPQQYQAATGPSAAICNFHGTVIRGRCACLYPFRGEKSAAPMNE